MSENMLKDKISSFLNSDSYFNLKIYLTKDDLNENNISISKIPLNKIIYSFIDINRLSITTDLISSYKLNDLIEFFINLIEYIKSNQNDWIQVMLNKYDKYEQYKYYIDNQILINQLLKNIDQYLEYKNMYFKTSKNWIKLYELKLNYLENKNIEYIFKSFLSTKNEYSLDSLNLKLTIISKFNDEIDNFIWDKEKNLFKNSKFVIFKVDDLKNCILALSSIDDQNNSKKIKDIKDDFNNMELDNKHIFLNEIIDSSFYFLYKLKTK